MVESRKETRDIKEVKLPSEKVKRKLRRYTGRLKTSYLTGRDMKTFIRYLKYEIEGPIVVVDVRWNTYHKSAQGFDPKSFEANLKVQEIEYIHLKALGNAIKDLYTKKEWEAAKEDYQNHLKYNSKARAAVKELIKLLRFKKTCVLICYCDTNDPNMCHRFWLKEHVVNEIRAKEGLPRTYKLYSPQKTLLEVQAQDVLL